MPVFIILIWVAASGKFSQISADMKKKILMGSAGFMIVCGLLLLHIRHNGVILISSSLPKSNGANIPVSTNEPITGYSVTYQRDGVIGKPVTHIAYIKTHKTGSSTIWSILIGYAVTNNLTIALPSQRTGNKLGWPEFFAEKYATPRKPDVLCHHSRYSEAMLSFMPNDTFYLTSMREPAEQLHSAYTYFNAERCLLLNYSQFLHKLDTGSLDAGRCLVFMRRWLNNGQMFDLGLETGKLKKHTPADEEKVWAKIKEIDGRFGMVIILERLDESLILLRDFLNWTTEDLVYFKNNFQMELPEKFKSSSYTELQKSIARSWNWADQLAYKHFSQKLAQTIDRDPVYYAEQVKQLQLRQSLWKTRCVYKIIPAAASENKDAKSYPGGTGTYLLTSQGKQLDRCILLATTEVAKVRLLNAGYQINTESYARSLNDTIASQYGQL